MYEEFARILCRLSANVQSAYHYMSYGCNLTLKYSVFMDSLHSQRYFKTTLLVLLGVAELNLDVIDPIIL